MDATDLGMNVGDVLLALFETSPKAPLVVEYDCGCAEGTVQKVEVRDDGTVVIVID